MFYRSVVSHTNPDLIPKVCLIFELYVLCLKYRIFSFFFLFHVILHGADRRTSQNEDYRKINERHQSHEHISHIPDKTEFHSRSDQYDQCRGNAEAVDQCLAGFLPQRNFSPISA